jgi:hypothetical protein
MYINIRAAINILLFSATAEFCPNANTIKKYNSSPMISECNNIESPRSIILYKRRIFFILVFDFAKIRENF